MTVAKKARGFNSHAFLSTIGEGRHRLPFKKKAIIFTQGDGSGGLFFVQQGKVQLSVESEGGKQAILGILDEDDFFGEGGLADQLVRASSATAVTDCVHLHIEKRRWCRPCVGNQNCRPLL